MLNTGTEELVSYPQGIWNSLKNTSLVSASFDFSWGLVFLTILIGHLKTTHDNTNPLDVAPLALTLFESAIVIFMSIYFAYSQELSPIFVNLANPIVEETISPETIAEDTELVSPSAEDKLLFEMGSLYKAGMLISVPLIAGVVLPNVFLEPILVALGQEPKIAAAAQQFSRILTISAPFLLLRFLKEQYFMAANKFMVPMAIAMPSLLVGTALGAFLTFGPPRYNLEGIACGFVVSAILSAIGFNIYGNRFEPFSKIPFYSQWHLKSIFTQLLKILKNGIPFMLQYAGELSAGFALSIFAGHLGADQLACWNFAQGLIFLTKIPQVASGIAALNCYGAQSQNSPQNAVREAYASVAASFVPIGLFCLPTLIEPKLLLWTFSSTASPEIQAMAKEMLRIIAAGILISAPNVVFMFVPKIKGDTWIPHAITIASVWAGAGGGYLLANQAKLDINGLAIGYTAGASIATTLNGIRFFRSINSAAARPTFDIQCTEDTESSCFSAICGRSDPDETTPTQTL